MKKDIFKPIPMKVTIWKDKKRYGDRDLDGTPNKYDCDPRDASKDGLLARALGIVSKDKIGQTEGQFKEERFLKRKEAQKRRLAKIKFKRPTASRIREAKLQRKIQRISQGAPTSTKLKKAKRFLQKKKGFKKTSSKIRRFLEREGKKIGGSQ